MSRKPPPEPPVRLEWLQSLTSVVETGSFSKAARALQLSQPSVSTHLRQLEAALGTALVEKIGGRVRLTPPGAAAVAEARELLEGLRRLREAAAGAQLDVRGGLTVAASTTPANYVLPTLLGRFERSHPGVRTRLVVGNSARVLDLLSRNEADLGALGIEPPPAAFESRPLGWDDIVIFAHRDHPLARQRGAVSPADCARHRFLIRESDSATRRLSDGWFSRHGIRPAVMELGCPETLKRAAAAGLGIGILSKDAVSAPGGETEFRILRVPGFPIRRRLYIAWMKRKRLNRTMTSFLDLAAGR